MPVATARPSFETITVKELHPTFAAEIEGVDFQKLSDQQYEEVIGALAKVSRTRPLCLSPC